jgi:hypothetical protein
LCDRARERPLGGRAHALLLRGGGDGRGGDDPAGERQHGLDIVIIDGSAMSYRRYTVEEN